MSADLSDGPAITASQPNRSQVLAYLRTLPELPTEPPLGPRVLEPLPATTEIELDGIIHKQQHAVRLTNQFDELGVLELGLQTLWPAAAVQGRSLLGNRPAPIGLDRAPGTISVTSLVPSTTAQQSRSC